MPDTITKGRSFLSVIQWLGPPLLGLIGAYGGVTFMIGSWQQRVITIENQHAQLQRDVASINDRLDHEQDDLRSTYPTRAEIQPQFDFLREQLKEIRTEVNDWRRGK